MTYLMPDHFSSNSFKFYTSYKGQDADVNRTSESLLGSFQFLSSTLQSRTFRPDELKNIESSVDKLR